MRYSLKSLAAVAGLLILAAADSAHAQVRATPVSSDSKTTAANDVVIEREVFSYMSGGRRDPYVSLMSSNELRPLLSDIRVTAIAWDPTGKNSIAIIRDSFSGAQYRARVGQQLGRMKVSAITAKAVQFSIEEYGFSRTESLKVTSDSTTARNP